MTIAFQCPNCQATRNAPDAMIGRRVRCPECDELVEVVPLPVEAESNDPADQRDTMMLPPVNSATSGETVLLEAVEDNRLEGRSSSLQDGSPPRNPPAPPEVEPDDQPPNFKKSQLVETEMDMTPMVDATFQLLIFFMITAAFALQKSKEIPKPRSDEASTNVVQQEEEDTANSVVVRIDEFNSYLVINADGDEEEAPSVVDLHNKLRRAHDGDSEGRVPTKLRIEAHGEALHERVITAIDAGNDSGFAEVELASLEDDA